MKRAAGFLITLLVAGCSTQYSALNPNPDRPAVIYAVPRSQALSIAHTALLSAAPRYGANYVHIDELDSGQFRGYQATYQSQLYGFMIIRRLFVIPTTGTAVNGQPVDGFRFVIIRAGCNPHRGPGGDCDKPLAGTLQAALDETGAASSVTRLTSHDVVYDGFSDPGFTNRKP